MIIIKNKKLVDEFMDMIVNVKCGEDGIVGLDEFLYGVYGGIKSVKKLKRDILIVYGIKIGVNEENEFVYVCDGDGDDE